VGIPRHVRSVRRAIKRLGSPLVATGFSSRQHPASRGGYVQLDTWRNREWYPALDAAGIAKRGPYHLRHTFATEALAGGVSIFELAGLMGTSVKMIDKTYGHLAQDSEEAIQARLETRGGADAQRQRGQ
jgi:integrase